MKTLRANVRFLVPGVGKVARTFDRAKRGRFDAEAVKREIEEEELEEQRQEEPAHAEDVPLDGEEDEDEHLDAAIDEAVELAAAIAGEEPAPPVIAEPRVEPAVIVRTEDGDVPHDDGDGDDDDDEAEEEEVDRDDQVEALRAVAAGLRDQGNMRNRAFAALARLVPQNMRYDAHIHGRPAPAAQEIELAQATAARELRIWLGPLPRPMWHTLGSASPIRAMVLRGPAVFRADVPRVAARDR
jgi:hypothetical protein